MSEIYRMFSEDLPNMDFSEESALEMYQYETNGKGDLKIGLFGSRKHNGYMIGKHWMDATVKMWRQDIKQGLLRRDELLEYYPEWWLNRVL